MNRLVSFGVACALIIAGIGKMVVQASHQETLLIPTCLGNSLTVHIGGDPWSALHCWGCYSFLLGLVVLAALTVQNVRRQRAMS